MEEVRPDAARGEKGSPADDAKIIRVVNQET